MALEAVGYFESQQGNSIFSTLKHMFYGAQKYFNVDIDHLCPEVDDCNWLDFRVFIRKYLLPPWVALAY